MLISSYFFLSFVFWFSCAFSCSYEPGISQTGTSIHESAFPFVPLCPAPPWFTCAFVCSSEPAVSQTGTSIHESASPFGMAEKTITTNDAQFSISAKIASHSDSIKIANAVSTFFNDRSSKIVMLNETLSINALELKFLARMSITAKSARTTLNGHLTNALGVGTQTLLTVNVKTCSAEQANSLELSECTRIEWKFYCPSSPVLTVLSSKAQSNVTEQPQNPRGVGQAAAAAVFSCYGAADEASLNLSVIESETSSMTAAGAYPRPFMVAKTYKADLRLCRK